MEASWRTLAKSILLAVKCLIGRLFAGTALMAVSVGACGSSGDGTSGIAGFTACGGSLAGTWRVVATEVDIEHSPHPARGDTFKSLASCGRYVTSASWNAEGLMMSFVPATSSDPDVAVYARTTEGSQSFVETLNISAACARDSFNGASCELVAARLAPDAEITCDTSMAPCTCISIYADMSASTEMLSTYDGEYFTDGTTGEYCRKGVTLEQAQRGITGNIVTWMQLQKI